MQNNDDASHISMGQTYRRDLSAKL
jgi:hypothetical protein